MTPKSPFELMLNDSEPIQLLQVNGLKPDEWQKLPSRDKVLYTQTDGEYNIPENIWKTELRSGKHYNIPISFGGSDISAILDGSEFEQSHMFYAGQHGSNYKIALQLFHEKIGVQAQLKEVQDDYILWNGHNCEEEVAQKFARAYKKDHPFDKFVMWNDSHMYQCGQKNADGSLKYPFAVGNFDRKIMINGLVGILEIKTISFSAAEFSLVKQGICPLKYLVQVLYYLAISNLSFAYIAINSGYAENDLKYIYIERNLNIEADLLKMVSEFYNLCLTGEVPDVSGQNIKMVYKYMRRINGDYEPEIQNAIRLPKKFISDLQRLLEIKKLKAKLAKSNELLEDEEAALMVKILPSYGQAKSGTIEMDDGTKIVLKVPPCRANASVDEDKVLDQFPDLYRQYCNKFNATLFKKEQLAATAACMKDPQLSSNYTNYEINEVKGK